MKVAIRHTLTFDLGAPVRTVGHLLLTALPTPQQAVSRWDIDMPGMAEAAMFRDGFGNRAHLVSLVKPEGPITVSVTGQVETFDRAGVLGRLEYDPMPAMFRRQTSATEDGAGSVDGLSLADGRIALLHDLMALLHTGASKGSQVQQQSAGAGQVQTPSEAAVRDVAHLFIGGVRALNIPARYVTGYLLDERGGGGFHSWAEAWDEGLGWIGFDPTLNVCPTVRHIRLASGLDAMSTMPIRTVPVWPEMPAETVAIEVLQTENIQPAGDGHD